MSSASLDIDVPEALPGSPRLDRFLAVEPRLRHLELSRSRLQRLIRDGHVTVDDRTVQVRHPLAGGERIRLDLAAVAEQHAAGQPQSLAPEAIELSVLFEDDDLIVIDKPAGLVVHPGAGNTSGTLVNALLHHCQGRLATLGGQVDPERPGIVHRLDKETSGCLVAAKSDRAHSSLVNQFSSRTTRKIYRCIVVGQPSMHEHSLETRIARHPVHRQRMANVEGDAGKQAITAYRVLHHDDHGRWSHIECRLHTGRTHQIRVHMKESLGCPILGDGIYGKPARDPIKTGRLMLHALELGFDHPVSGERMDFLAPLPEAFAPFLPKSES